MDVEINAWLYDVLNSICEIESFILDMPDNFNAYQNDLKTRRAIERNIEIIGEAMKRVLEKNPSIEITDSRIIVDTRNRIIHGYDSVSDELVWSIVTSHLPLLKIEVSSLLGE
jgi:uncharacterized protein with HEPN domain